MRVRSGHKTPQVFSRYNIISSEDIAAAGLEKVSACIEEQQAKVGKVAKIG